MNLHELNKLLGTPELVEARIDGYLKPKGGREKPVLFAQPKVDEAEMQGHVEKAEHNLKFVQDNLKLGHYDWCITGCYYAVYHAALALVLKSGYASKNHDATLCMLIKHYYRKGVSKDEITLINKFFLDYHDLLFYAESKARREDATYSTRYKFDKQSVEQLRVKAILFVNKAKEILGERQ